MAGLAGLCLLLAAAAPVSAQTPRVEVTFGGVLAGPAAAGDVEATLLDSGGNPLVLFETSNRLSAGGGIEGAIALRLRQRLLVEVSGSWVRSNLESRISADFEDAEPLTASLGVHQIAVDGAVIYRWSRRGRWEPFGRAGAGWLRELTTDRALVANGLAASLSGGIKYWMRESGSGLFGRLALRAEARMLVRHGGITFGRRETRVSPALLLGLVIGR